MQIARMFVGRSGGLAMLIALLVLGFVSSEAARASIVGFGDTTNWTFSNNNAGFEANVPRINTVANEATMTTRNSGIASSLFYMYQQNISVFSAQFDYINVWPDSANNTEGDGVAFVIQNDPFMGSYAMGGEGGAAGYEGIPNSVAILINLYDDQDAPSIKFGENGSWLIGTSTLPVDVTSGNIIRTTVDYDGATATISMEERDINSPGTVLNTFASATEVSIPGLMGGDWGYVGFTGGTGNMSAEQRIGNFTFTEIVVPEYLWNGPAGANWGTSNWQDGGLPATTPAFPDKGVKVVIPFGSVNVAQDRAAMSLTVESGGVTIAGGTTLDVGKALFAEGTTLSMGLDSSFSAGMGNVGSVTTAGSATLINSGDLTIADLNDGGVTGTLTKFGAGTLSLATGGISLEKTTIAIREGTIQSIGISPLGGADLVLDGGTLDLGAASGSSIDRTDNPGLGILTDIGFNAAGETVIQAFDNDTSTKWLTFNPTGWLGYQFAGGDKYAINEYTIASANDAEARDPKDWVFEGSNDGVAWEVLDTRSGEDFPTRYLTRQFSFGNDTPYEYYRLDITANSGDTITQLSEIDLFEVTRFNPDMSDTTVLVTAPSEIISSSPEATVFGPLTIADGGALTTSGTTPSMSFAGLTIESGAKWIGLNLQVPTDFGPGGIDFGGANTVVAKVGSGVLELEATPIQNLGPEAMWSVEGGTLLLNNGEAALAGLPVRLDGGTLDIVSPTVGIANIPLTVGSDSTLRLQTLEQVSVGSLTIEGGVLTTAGAEGGIRFAGTTIVATDGVIGFNTEVDTAPGPITSVSTTATFVKTGPATLLLDQASTGLGGATIDVQQGNLIPLAGVASLGGAAINLSGGDLTLASPGGNVTFDKAVTVDDNSKITAGPGGVGVLGPITATLGSATNGLIVNSGNLTLESTDGYSLNVAGPISGSGGLLLNNGNVQFSAGGVIPTASVGSGVVVTSGASELAISDSLQVGSTSYAVSLGDTFRLTSADMPTGNGVVLTLQGGTVSSMGGANITGFGDAAEFAENYTINTTSGIEPVLMETDVLQITPRTLSQANSVYLNEKQNVTNFSVQFDYQNVGGYAGGVGQFADGMTFLMQNQGLDAIGVGGSNMGYMNGIGQSVALVFNIYDDHSRPLGIQIAQNGGDWNIDSYIDTSPINLKGGEVIHTQLDYDGNLLTVNLSNDAGDAFTTTFDVDIPNIVGGNTAWMGFTGSTGGVSANQEISNFQGDGTASPTSLIAVADSIYDATDAPMAVYEDITVKNGATLTLTGVPRFDVATVSGVEGGGSIVADLVVRGTLMPGDIPATVNVLKDGIDASGDVTLAEGAVYAVSFGEANVSDRLVADGTVTIGNGVTPGATLELALDGIRPFMAGTYTLIEANGEEWVTGKFAHVTDLKDYVTVGPDMDGLQYIDTLLTLTLDYNLHPGDANLDTVTDVRDFNVWNTNKFTSGTGWTTGDFDGNGTTDVRDFNVWNTNKFTSVNTAAPVAGGQVPEPGTLALLACGLIGLLAVWRRR